MPKKGFSTIILAGGFGVRTTGILNEKPKALIETPDGKTLLTHLLEDLKDSGLQNVSIISNSRYYPQILREAGQVKVLDDGAGSSEERRGALGDLILALDKSDLPKDNSVLVLSSDYAYWKSFKIEDFINFASQEKYKDSFVTMAWDTKDPGLIKGKYGCPILNENGFITSFEEKPQYPKSSLAILAFYIYRPRHVKLLNEFKTEGGNLDSPSNIIPFLLKKGEKVSVFVVRSQVVDAGTPEEINKARNY